MTAPKTKPASKPRGKATAKPSTPPSPEPTPSTNDTIKAPRRGPGRPKNPTAPRGESQAQLAEAVTAAEQALDLATAAAEQSSTIAAALLVLECEQRVASRWSAFCRAQGSHTFALRYAEQVAKLAGRASALREKIGYDRLCALEERLNHEDSLGSKR